MTVNTLPSSAEIISGTQQNAEQKVDFAATWDFLIQRLGTKSGQGPQTVASATSVDLDAVVETRDLVISGVAAITGFVVEAGKVFRCRASGAFTLTNNSGIVTNTGANIVCAAGHTFMLRATATNTAEVLFYTSSAPSYVRVNTSNGQGSTNTAFRRFTTVIGSAGGDVTYADSATLGATFTINTAGIYAMSYTDVFGASYYMGISVNSSQGNTSVKSMTAANRLTMSCSIGLDVPVNCAVTIPLQAGDIIRAHVDAGAVGSGVQGDFTITRVS